MRPTPETDAIVRRYLGNEGISAEEVSRLLDHARNLERQRDELLEALEETRRLASESKEGFEEDLPGVMDGIVREADAAIANVKGTNK